MPMNYDNDENSQMSGSIFSNPELINPTPVQQPPAQEEKKPTDLLSNLIRHITSKIIDPETGQSIKEQKKLQKIIEKVVEEHGDLLQIFEDFGAKLIYKEEKTVEIVVPKFGMTGEMRTDENGEIILDDNAKEIFTKMAHYVNSVNSFEFSMHMYEQLGFYPVGELVAETITYKGKELKVQKGVLMNDKGESKNIYIYKGQELILDDEENS